MIYHIDKDDKITFVNSNWVKFATENGMPLKEAKTFLGKRLWRYIDDMNLRHFYKVLFDKVRRSGESITIPLRCDSLKLIRFMKMKITLLESGDLEVRSRLLRQQKRESGGAQAKKLPHNLVMCLGCDKVESVGWLEPDHAAQKMKILETNMPLTISHSVCPQCHAEGFSTIIQ